MGWNWEEGNNPGARKGGLGLNMMTEAFKFQSKQFKSDSVSTGPLTFLFSSHLLKMDQRYEEDSGGDADSTAN